MKHYFDMFLKANNRVRNGSRRHSHDPRKATCRNHKWRQSSSLSSISRVTVHFEFIPQDQTINGAYYVEIWKRLREPVHRRRSELWSSDWILHHDSAPAGKTLTVKQFMDERSINEMGHPPCFLILIRMTTVCSRNKVFLKGTKISR